MAKRKRRIRQVSDQTRAKVESTLDRMRNRTPLRLTAEDEAIMREDWLLDPHKLPQVRIYQEMLSLMRQVSTLRVQVSERDEKLREYEESGAVPVRLTDGSGVTARDFGQVQAVRDTPAGPNAAMLTLLERLMDDFKTYLRAST